MPNSASHLSFITGFLFFKLQHYYIHKLEGVDFVEIFKNKVYIDNSLYRIDFNRADDEVIYPITKLYYVKYNNFNKSKIHVNIDEFIK